MSTYIRNQIFPSCCIIAGIFFFGPFCFSEEPQTEREAAKANSIERRFIPPGHPCEAQWLREIEEEEARTRFTIEPNKDKYLLGEPIFFVTTLQDKLPDNVLEKGYYDKNGYEVSLVDNYMEIEYRPAKDADTKNNKWKPVPITRYGKEKLEIVVKNDKSSGYMILRNTGERGDDMDLYLKGSILNLLYDMTLPGTYRITLYCCINYVKHTMFSHRGHSDTYTSNTITIEVTDDYFHNDALKEPGGFGGAQKTKVFEMRSDSKWLPWSGGIVGGGE